MKTMAIVCSVLFGSWFWQRASVPSGGTWPQGMPVFAGGRADGAYTLSSGSSLAVATVHAGRRDALASVRKAFLAESWMELPVHPQDMLIFTRGDSVAAVLAETVPDGTRLTAIQRPSGL